MKLIFEQATAGMGEHMLPPLDVPACDIGDAVKRTSPPRLPQLSENEISRHYSALARRAHGVNDGFYPLGSCTMKYNPKINEAMASLPGFTGIHPLQDEDTVQGALEALYLTEHYLCEVTGMDAMTFQPAAGAHGELTGLMLIKRYHESRGDKSRTQIIVPDSAHGTNPASAAMVDMSVISIPSGPDGLVDLAQLKKVLGPDTAGLMLTNPNTLGLFEKDILAITELVHEAGGLVYYDGANLNAVMGMVRPGDMGFDCVHLNLHKTFSTPHGGGGPGSGPVGCKAFLAEFLPGPQVKKEGDRYRFDCLTEASIGKVKAFYGNFLVDIRALSYLLFLGGEGLKEAAQNAVLNANYFMKKLSACYEIAYDRPCMHEFVITMAGLKKEKGVTASDIAKALIDNHIHPPTMYFPLIVPEALMVEPVETESQATLDAAAETFLAIYRQAVDDPDSLHAAPISTPVGRVDETAAARSPKLRYQYE